MTAEEFWSLIDLSRQSVRKTTDIPEWIQEYLRQRPTLYLGEYEERFQGLSRLSYDARLWAAAQIMMGFCSDDKFSDFRAWLIAKGKDVFEDALKNPDTLAEVDVDGDYGTPTLFSMNYVAEETYRERAGDSADITDLIAEQPPATLLNEGAWDEDQAKLPAMFPRLYAKFGNRR
jgi:hypothetical protein